MARADKPKPSGDDSASPDGLAPLEGLTPFEAAVVIVLNATRPGDVMSYGELAAEAGFPGAARAVGGVLKRVDGLAWWRVINANGRVNPHKPVEQIQRLSDEGVVVRNGKVVFG